jgi:hypothetical protein
VNPAELEALLAGLLRLWQIEARLTVTRIGDGLMARIESAAPSVTVEQTVQPFGIAWHVQAEGGRRLVYPSTIGMIRRLREELAPDRGAARVVFAAGAG